MRWTLISLLALCCAPIKAEPLGFARAYEGAVRYDAQLESARQDLRSTREAVGVARSSLLPQVSLVASDNVVRGERDFSNGLNQPVTVALDYSSPQTALQLRAPLYSAEASARYRQAQRQAQAGESVFRMRQAELLDRLTTAYLQRLLAQEALRLAGAQETWLTAQVERAQQRLDKGEGSRIELADAQAQWHGAKARKAEAQDQLRIARAALARVVGQDEVQVRTVSPDFQPPLLTPGDLESWQVLALRHNPTVQARQENLEVARLGVARQSAGHQPRLDLVGSVAANSNESVSNLNQRTRLASLGVQLNMPLYSGGGVTASVRQAQAELSKAEADLENERRAVSVDVERQYLAARNGVDRIGALSAAVSAHTLMLEGVERGVAAGLRTSSEILEVRSRLTSAQRELAQARLEVLLARSRLLALSGSAPSDVAADLERWLVNPSEGS